MSSFLFSLILFHETFFEGDEPNPAGVKVEENLNRMASKEEKTGRRKRVASDDGGYSVCMYVCILPGVALGGQVRPVMAGNIIR
jgi:hypothetical protein